MTATRGKPLRRLAGVRSELSKVRNEIGMVSGHPASRTSSEVSDVLASVSRACGGISLERVLIVFGALPVLSFGGVLVDLISPIRSSHHETTRDRESGRNSHEAAQK